MPSLALEWTHALLRLLLKYREVVPLGTVSERILDLARRLRSLQERIADPLSTFTLLVALPETLSVGETERLLPSLRSLGITPGALLINRVLDNGRIPHRLAAEVNQLRTVAAGLPSALAPQYSSGPRQPADLLRYIEGWRLLLETKGRAD
jgi:anion-transporting  ArsA/GET3 family ATPase